MGHPVLGGVGFIIFTVFKYEPTRALFFRYRVPKKLFGVLLYFWLIRSQFDEIFRIQEMLIMRNSFIN